MSSSFDSTRRHALALTGAVAASVILPATARAAATDPLLAQAARILAETSRSEVRPYSTRDFGRARYGQARSVVVMERVAPQILKRVRDQLPAGTIAFVGETDSLATPKVVGAEIVVARGNSQFDCIRIAEVSPLNHGLDAEKVVQELTRWNEQVGLDIWRADTDEVQMSLKTLPQDLVGFAKKVEAFCPDIVTQGVGTVDNLARQIRQRRGVALWWD